MSATWYASFGSVCLLVGALCLLVAAAHDVIARTAPNWTAAVLAVSGLTLRLLHGQLLAGLAVGLVVFLAAAFCWRRGWMGGGDVKLLAAAAIFVPPAESFTFITVVAVTGGLLALIYLAARRVVRAPSPVRPRGLLLRALRVEQWRIRRGGPLPYACAIAAGGLFVLL
jgi:prepilin peptidase CpaA